MVIIGARGFAKELIMHLLWNNQADDLWFFDNINADTPDILYERFPVLKSWDALQEHFLSKSPEFILGVGGPKTRKTLSEKAASIGGQLCSIVSNQAHVAGLGNKIGDGVCIMSHAIISCDVHIGDGTLVNKAVTIGHDSKVGKWCQISPGARLLGGATIGDFTEIGANAVIISGISVGLGCKVGAGAVLTRNVPDGLTVVGIPARPIEGNTS